MLQQLELLPVSVLQSSLNQEQSSILDIIGVKIPFETPFYLFILPEDLNENSGKYIHFVGYQMKSPGPAFWGYMTKDGKTINLNGSCYYRTNMLNDLLKQWKKNGFQYVSGSVKNRSSERINVYANTEINNFDKMEERKKIASYYRNEIPKPKDVDHKSIQSFMVEIDSLENEEKWDEIINILAGIDKEGTFINPKNIMFVRYEDYERYKAFLALYQNKITLQNFQKLYPWKYTLDMMYKVIFDTFGIKGSKKEELNKDVSYLDKLGNVLNILEKAIENYENGLNKIDITANYRQIESIIVNFFKLIETRKLKINPTLPCPLMKDCINLDGSWDMETPTCKVYYFPKEGELL